MEQKKNSVLFYLVKYGLVALLFVIMPLTVRIATPTRGNVLTYLGAAVGAIAALIAELVLLRKVKKKGQVWFFVLLGLIVLDFTVLFLLMNRILWLALLIVVVSFLLNLFFAIPMVTVKTRYRDAQGHEQVRVTHMVEDNPTMAKYRVEQELYEENQKNKVLDQRVD